MRTIVGSTLVLTAMAIGSTAYGQEVTGKERRVANVDTNVTTDVTVVHGPTANTDTVVETRIERGQIPAPKSAFELGVEGGYTQPFGELGDGRSFRNVAEAGGAAGLTLGYRFTPHWALSLTGQFHDNVGDDNLGRKTDVRGIAVGIKGTYHILPYRLVDPYVSLGGGYRAMWLAPDGAPNDMVHGFQLARALVGVDFRVSRDVSLGPVVGADLDLFTWDNPQGGASNQQLNEPRPSTFLFGGLAATFDVGGRRIVKESLVARTYPVAQPASTPGTPREVRPKLEPTGIMIDLGILSACHIEGPNAFFAFDSSNLKGNDTSRLEAVAKCFTDGPLKGKNLQVTGHADPRGTDEYNMQLGQSRAESVAQFLTGQGVPGPNVQTNSEGKREAQGVDESGWSFDRRVDLRLGQ